MAAAKAGAKRFAAAPARARRSDPERIPTRAQSRIALDATVADDARRRVAQRLGKHAGYVQQVTLRFVDDGDDAVACRISATLRGLPAAIVEERGRDATIALRRAADTLGRTLHSALRHVGRARPTEDSVRALPDAPARSDEPRNTAGMTVALEESRAAPSRKSTRRSTNRIKAATPKQRTTQLAAHAPTAAATRARARQGGKPS